MPTRRWYGASALGAPVPYLLRRFQSLRWREKYQVDALLEWQPPEVLEKYYPSGLSGFDAEGSPGTLLYSALPTACQHHADIAAQCL